MLSFGNKEFKNLQEQVLQNSNAIEALTQGLKIIGVGPIIPASLKDGEAYLVGTAAPYDLKIKIDGNIVDLGQFPKEGPKGDQGPAGPISKLNSISTTTKTIDSGMNASVTAQLDHNIHNVMFSFEIPRGEQGPVGPRGPQDPIGKQGPQGPVGPRGEVAYAVKILATIANTSLLPDPKSVDRNAGYLVGTTSPYNLYVIIGEDTLTWFNIGPFTNEVDANLSTTSTNAIQNRVVTESFNELQGQVNNNETDIGNINQFFEKNYANLNSDATINKGLVVGVNGDVTVQHDLTVENRLKLKNGFTPKSQYSSAGFTIGIIAEWFVQDHPDYRSFIGVRLVSGITTGDFIYGWYKPASTVLNYGFTYLSLDNKFYIMGNGTDPYGNPAQSGQLAFQKTVDDIESNLTTDINGLNAITGDLRTAANSEWQYITKVAEKTFSKAFTEVKPGKSGIPNGNATVNVIVTTYGSPLPNNGYKTVMDITCRCPQFNLKDTGLSVLLSKVGSRWFMPRIAIGKGDIVSTPFNNMMDRLNEQKDNVGIAVEDVAVFKDNRGVSGNPGSLNVSGVTNAQVVYDAAEFRLFAVRLELDKDNEGKSIPCTGVHYRLAIYHPLPIV